jgi:hypothetical protein
MKRLGFILLFIAGLGIQLTAQEFSSFKPSQFSKDTNYGSFNYVHLMYFKGDHLTYPQGFEDAFSHGYNAFELRLGWQSTGRQTWQQLHKYPVYGLGVFASSLGTADVDSVVGAPSGIYFFYGEPLFRVGKKFTSYFDLAIGLSYDFVPYDAENNPANDVIGSRVNLYFNGNIMFMYEASERLDFNLGFNFFHFSNGRSNTPQRGINMGGLNIGAKYNFNAIKGHTKLVDPNYQPPIRPTYIKEPKPKLERFGELQFMASVGTVETEPGEAKTSTGEQDTTALQKRYYTSTIAVDYAYKVAHRLKLHAGLDAFVDGSLENYIPNTAPQDVTSAQKFMAGYHVGFQYLIERFSFYYSLGWYMYKETDTRGNWYMRAGGRIGLTDDIDAHIALKTRNGGIADWIEWGVAYKLKL